MEPQHRDRVLDWRFELRRIEPELASLPPAARRAVLATVERFLREDERSGRVAEAAGEAA